MNMFALNLVEMSAQRKYTISLSRRQGGIRSPEQEIGSLEVEVESGASRLDSIYLGNAAAQLLRQAGAKSGDDVSLPWSGFGQVVNIEGGFPLYGGVNSEHCVIRHVSGF